MKKREKYGEILGGIFEHEILYRIIMMLIIGVTVLLQIIAFHFYGLQLDVLSASYYQLIIMVVDILSIFLIIGLFEILYLKYLYDNGKTDDAEKYYYD